MRVEKYLLEDKVTLYEYLLHNTFVGDRCDILDSGYNAISCIIDSEDLFIRNIDEDLLYNNYVTKVEIETVIIKHEDGREEEEIRRIIFSEYSTECEE